MRFPNSAQRGFLPEVGGRKMHVQTQHGVGRPARVPSARRVRTPHPGPRTDRSSTARVGRRGGGVAKWGRQEPGFPSPWVPAHPEKATEGRSRWSPRTQRPEESVRPPPALCLRCWGGAPAPPGAAVPSPSLRPSGRPKRSSARGRGTRAAAQAARGPGRGVLTVTSASRGSRSARLGLLHYCFRPPRGRPPRARPRPRPPVPSSAGWGGAARLRAKPRARAAAAGPGRRLPSRRGAPCSDAVAPPRRCAGSPAVPGARASPAPAARQRWRSPLPPLP